MKKLMTILLALSLVLSMAACGSSAASTAADTAASTAAASAEAVSAAAETQTEAEATAAPEAAAPAAAEEETSAVPAEETAADAAGETAAMFPQQANIPETVLYDGENIKITATGIDYSGYNPTISLTVENGNDYEICVQTGSGYTVVNGYMVSSTVDLTVGAGATADGYVMLYTEELMMLGITEISDLTLSVEIQALDVDMIPIVTEPVTLTTGAAQAENYGAGFSEGVQSAAAQEARGYTVTYFGEGPTDISDELQLLSEAVLSYDDGTTALVMEVVNNGAETRCITTNDLTINELGLGIGIWDLRTITPGSRAVLAVSFDPVRFQYILDTYQISEIGSMGVTLRACDSDGSELGSELTFAVEFNEAADTYTASGTEIYNEGGVTICLSGAVNDDSYGNDCTHILLTVTNASGGTVGFYNVPDTFYVNGSTAEGLLYSDDLADGMTGIINMEISNEFLRDSLGINDPSEIQSAELTLELLDGEYNAFDTPTLTMNFGG